MTAHRSTCRLGAALLLAAAAIPAQAEDAFGIGARSGTLGLGVELFREVGPFTFRLGLNRFDYEFDRRYDGIDYDMELNLDSASFVVDWHPARSSFRIGAGVLRNGNSIGAIAQPASSYDIGGFSFTEDQVGQLAADVTFDDFAPYGGIGWDAWFGRERRIGLTFDLGLLLQGSPQATLTSSAGQLSDDPMFLQALEQEEQDFQDAIDSYEYYPVAALGLVIRF